MATSQKNFKKMEKQHDCKTLQLNNQRKRFNHIELTTFNHIEQTLSEEMLQNLLNVTSGMFHQNKIKAQKKFPSNFPVSVPFGNFYKTFGTFTFASSFFSSYFLNFNFFELKTFFLLNVFFKFEL